MQYCCANLWGGNLSGDLIQFTVTLYKSYKLFFLKHGDCKNWGVCKYGSCTSFNILIIATCMLAVGLGVLPGGYRVCGGFPQTIHLYHFGFELPIYKLCSYCNFMQICQFWLHLAGKCWEAQGYLHGPSLLAYLCKGNCDMARVRV